MRARRTAKGDRDAERPRRVVDVAIAADLGSRQHLKAGSRHSLSNKQRWRAPPLMTCGPQADHHRARVPRSSLLGFDTRRRAGDNPAPISARSSGNSAPAFVLTRRPSAALWLCVAVVAAQRRLRPRPARAVEPRGSCGGRGRARPHLRAAAHDGRRHRAYAYALLDEGAASRPGISGRSTARSTLK